MGGSISQIAFYALGGCVVGAVTGWLIHLKISHRRIGQMTSQTRAALVDVTRQRDELASEYTRSRSTIDALKAVNAKRRTQFGSLLEKSRILAKNVRTLRKERENTKSKVSTIQNALVSLRQRSSALQTEFDKSRAFYKRELAKSFEKRKLLKDEIKEARAEQESFARLVESSVLEHGSAENMLAAAQLRLGQLDVLERNVSKLEAENEQLRNDAVRMKQQLAVQDKDRAKLKELKLHNAQLVSCVEALEGSRQEYEADAERFREKADQSEKESDTLRLKLDDLEKSFADIEMQQHRALEDARNETVVPILRKQS